MIDAAQPKLYSPVQEYPMSLLPQKSPASPSTLWTPEFILLFLLAMFANSYLAVFYCFEHWLAVQGITPHWRGLLLGTLGFAVLCTRPVISVWLLRHRGLPLMGLAIALNSVAMCLYSLAGGGGVLPILLLRLIQGVALAAFSSTVVAVLVECIPEGQSARGFAIFSLTTLLPYSLIPSLGEQLLPILGSEPRLYMLTATLGIPALIMLGFLARRFRGRPPRVSDQKYTVRALWQGLRTSGLGPLFWASGLFGCTVVTVIYFIKGLTQTNGAHAGAFFMTYTAVVIGTRLLTNRRLDALPPMPTITGSALTLCLMVMAFALCPGWMLLPLACVYGVGLGLLYPMVAASIYNGSTEDTRSLNSNIMMLAYDASNVASPLMGGALLDAGFGYTGVFMGGAACMALTAVMAQVYRRRQNA